jgi:hypothetical protein
MQLWTTSVIENHLQAARKGVDAVMEDYGDESVLVTPDATYRGVGEIRGFFTAFLESLPAGFFDAFRLNRQEAIGDNGYILWQATPWVLLATDTFVSRNGKTRFQTFAAYTAEHRD